MEPQPAGTTIVPGALPEARRRLRAGPRGIPMPIGSVVHLSHVSGDPFPSTATLPMAMLRYFGITFVVSWTLWAAAAGVGRAAGSERPVLTAVAGGLFLLGVFAPGAVALLETGRTAGGGAVRDLLGRVVRHRVPLRYYLIAAGYFASAKLVVALVYRAVEGAWPPTSAVPWFLMVAGLLFSTWVQAGEEVGWRGYALPGLAERMGVGSASILLGVVWAVWHLPQFVVFEQADTFGQSFPVWLLQVTAISVALAWLYWRSGGSLLLVMLMHAGVNNTNWVPSGVPGATDPFALSTSLVAWLTMAVLWVIAILMLFDMRKQSAARRPSGSAGHAPPSVAR